MNKLLTRANKRVSLGGAASLLIGVTLVGQLLGFVRNRLISTNFTVNDAGSSDAFFAAFQIPDFFFYTIAAGALGVAFIPILADRLAVSDKKGVWDLVSSLLNTLAIVMGCISIIILIFARPLMHTLAPNLPPNHLHEAVVIMRLLALNPLLFTLSGIITSVQQTFGRFFFYAVAPLFYNLSIIASVFIFKDSLGIIGLGVGAAIGGGLQLIVACMGLFGLGFRYRPIINFKNKEFKRVLRQLPPRSIDQGIDQINNIVETNRAQSLGTGPVSYYNFATTIMNVPVMLFGTAIATAAFPRLSERLAQNRPDLFHKEFFQVLRTMIWLSMPATVIGYFTRGYLARLLYGGAAPEVALIFGYLTVAVFFRIIYSIISRYFYAQKDTWTPLAVSLFAIGLNIYLAFTLVRPDSYGISGLALAQSLVAVVEVLLLGIVMLARNPRLFNAKFWGSIVKIISVTGFSLIAAFIMISLLPLNASDKGFAILGFKLGSIAGVTLLVHLMVSAIFGLEEAQLVIRKVSKFVLRPIRIQ